MPGWPHGGLWPGFEGQYFAGERPGVCGGGLAEHLAGHAHVVAGHPLHSGATEVQEPVGNSQYCIAVVGQHLRDGLGLLANVGCHPQGDLG